MPPSPEEGAPPAPGHTSRHTAGHTTGERHPRLVQLGDDGVARPQPPLLVLIFVDLGGLVGVHLMASSQALVGLLIAVGDLILQLLLIQVCFMLKQ